MRWAITFTYTTATWLFFLERDSSLLREKAWSLIRPGAYHMPDLRQFQHVFANPQDIVVSALIFFVATIALIFEGIGIRRSLEPYHFGRRPAVSIALVFLLVWLSPLEESSFIYFNF